MEAARRTYERDSRRPRYSIKHSYDVALPFNTKDTKLTTCSAARPAANDPANYQRVDGSGEVVFTYDGRAEIVWS